MASEKAVAEPQDVGEHAEEPRDLVELVLEDHARRGATRAPERIDGVVVGRMVALGLDGRPMVEFDAYPGPPVAARAMLAVAAADVGRECALLFEGGSPDKPILMGWMFEPVVPLESAVTEQKAEQSRPTSSIEQDGERVVLQADKEIVLRCGNASITLTRAGKILIRGAYLLARASGVNRIQGGSVQIN